MFLLLRKRGFKVLKTGTAINIMNCQVVNVLSPTLSNFVIGKKIRYTIFFSRDTSKSIQHLKTVSKILPLFQFHHAWPNGGRNIIFNECLFHTTCTIFIENSKNFFKIGNISNSFPVFLSYWLVNKDKEKKYATKVTSKLEIEILKIGISQFRFHQNVQVEFAYQKNIITHFFQKWS